LTVWTGGRIERSPNHPYFRSGKTRISHSEMNC
jgi:hypothetical protein